GSTQQADIVANRHKLKALRKASVRIFGISCNQARDNTRLSGTCQDVGDSLLNPRMARLSQESHAGGQIIGSQEHDIEALHSKDAFDVLDGLDMLDLHYHQLLLVCM